MKKTAIAALALVLTLLLCACSGTDEAGFSEFKQSLSSASELSFTARLRAEYENKTESFVLEFYKSADTCTVEVTEPEIIKGIRAHIDADSDRLEYDGIILDVGKLTDDGLTPMSALPVLIDSLPDALLVSAFTEGDMLCALLSPEEGLLIKLWLMNDTLTPVSAEMNVDGVSVIFADIENWRITNERPAEENMG